jgi:hypothetical protein
VEFRGLKIIKPKMFQGFKFQRFFKQKSSCCEVCGRPRYAFVQYPSLEQALPVESPPAKRRQRDACVVRHSPSQMRYTCGKGGYKWIQKFSLHVE